MPLRDQPALRVILYEGPGARRLEAETRFEALATLLERGYAVTRTAGAGAVAPADASPALLLADFDENDPVEFAQADLPVRTRPIRGLSPAQIADTVETVGHELGAARHGCADRRGDRALARIRDC